MVNSAVVVSFGVLAWFAAANEPGCPDGGCAANDESALLHMKTKQTPDPAPRSDTADTARGCPAWGSPDLKNDYDSGCNGCREQEVVPSNPKTDWGQCCNQCETYSWATSFTMAYDSGRCWMKSGAGEPDSWNTYNPNTISGKCETGGPAPPTPAPTVNGGGGEPNCNMPPACNHYQTGCGKNCEQNPTQAEDWGDCCRKSKGYNSWTFVYESGGNPNCYLKKMVYVPDCPGGQINDGQAYDPNVISGPGR